jgi:catechol 2,3-dioxygenase-like lactoylglutathione lyase family enzyme
MAIELKKDSIDIGIIVRDSEAALKFYRDTLGLEHVADTPSGGGGTMHRLMCGTTMVKLVSPGELPAGATPPGGLAGASGIRYWTISVTNLDEITAQCSGAGYTVPVEPREIRPGVRISMVEDPDGNWVEFLENNE